MAIARSRFIGYQTAPGKPGGKSTFWIVKVRMRSISWLPAPCGREGRALELGAEAVREALVVAFGRYFLVRCHRTLPRGGSACSAICIPSSFITTFFTPPFA